ncbi:hypothetical protein BH10PSE19_BH10PSE19_21300 [soil metagenome]
MVAEYVLTDTFFADCRTTFLEKVPIRSEVVVFVMLSIH